MEFPFILNDPFILLLKFNTFLVFVRDTPNSAFSCLCALGSLLSVLRNLDVSVLWSEDRLPSWKANTLLPIYYLLSSIHFNSFLFMFWCASLRLLGPGLESLCGAGDQTWNPIHAKHGLFFGGGGGKILSHMQGYSGSIFDSVPRSDSW